MPPTFVRERSALRLGRTDALVAVHGNALTNLLLSPPGGPLRAAVQLVPSCLPTSTLSVDAYEVLGKLVAGRARSLPCDCTQPEAGKRSDVRCNASLVTDALIAMLGKRVDAR